MYVSMCVQHFFLIFILIKNNNNTKTVRFTVRLSDNSISKEIY